jgi:membrane protein DedA with SNARE-associated domain/rhodanese-related sulfurtransferase
MLHQVIERYGTLVLFINVFASALGLPVPAMPTLLIVGATIAMSATPWSGELALSLGAAVLGGVLGDTIWFVGGQRYGDRTLKTLCKLSLSRDTCVKKTERFFGRWGVRVLLIAKFVPGLSLVSVPLAGAMRVPAAMFVLHDAIGIGLWASAGLAVGVLFASQLEMVLAVISQLGEQAGAALVLALLCYIGYRWYRRRMLLRTLDTARMSVDELYALMHAGSTPVLLDIRSAEKRALDPFVIPGALPADERQLDALISRYARSQKIVIYCSCPNEISAAWMALKLRKAGYSDVIPLRGGLDAWRLAGRMLEPAMLASEADVAEVGAAPAMMDGRAAH